MPTEGEMGKLVEGLNRGAEKTPALKGLANETANEIQEVASAGVLFSSVVKAMAKNGKTLDDNLGSVLIAFNRIKKLNPAKQFNEIASELLKLSGGAIGFEAVSFKMAAAYKKSIYSMTGITQDLKKSLFSIESTIATSGMTPELKNREKAILSLNQIKL